MYFKELYSSILYIDNYNNYPTISAMFKQCRNVYFFLDIAVIKFIYCVCDLYTHNIFSHGFSDVAYRFLNYR